MSVSVFYMLHTGEILVAEFCFTTFSGFVGGFIFECQFLCRYKYCMPKKKLIEHYCRGVLLLAVQEKKICLNNK